MVPEDLMDWQTNFHFLGGFVKHNVGSREIESVTPVVERVESISIIRGQVNTTMKSLDEVRVGGEISCGCDQGDWVLDIMQCRFELRCIVGVVTSPYRHTFPVQSRKLVVSKRLRVQIQPWFHKRYIRNLLSSISFLLFAQNMAHLSLWTCVHSHWFPRKVPMARV